MSWVALEDYIAAVKAVLGNLGFRVEEGVTVNGLSGFVHSFDLAARKGGRVVYLSVKPANPLSLVAEVAKSVDVKEEVIIAVVGELAQSVDPSKGGRVRVVPFRSAEELAEKLKQMLA